jgi:hypothetical protein
MLNIFQENESPSAQIGKTEVASPISDAHSRISLHLMSSSAAVIFLLCIYMCVLLMPSCVLVRHIINFRAYYFTMCFKLIGTSVRSFRSQHLFPRAAPRLIYPARSSALLIINSARHRPGLSLI